LSQYQPDGQSSARLTAGAIVSDAKPTLATANPVAAAKVILRFFIFFVLLDVDRRVLVMVRHEPLDQ
jgi:hypothetical protein